VNLITGSAIHYGWYMPFGLLTPASWVATFTQTLHAPDRLHARMRCSKSHILHAAVRGHQSGSVLLQAFLSIAPSTTAGEEDLLDPLKIYSTAARRAMVARAVSRHDTGTGA
jgi:hypothetical protein